MKHATQESLQPNEGIAVRWLQSGASALPEDDTWLAELFRSLHALAKEQTRNDELFQLTSKALWKFAGLPRERVLGLPAIEDSAGILFKLLPAGRVMQGQDRRLGASEHPFEIGIFPVTQDQYFGVTGENPSSFKDPLNPVEEISWHDASDFCRQLSEATHYQYRLPTEAEWEYAHRAGTSTRFSCGDSAETLSEFAWFDQNSEQRSHPVGLKRPNAWGLHDSHGNVWEWCQDQLGSSDAQESGTSPGEEDQRIVRGGSWCYHAYGCQSNFRYHFESSTCEYYIGFRVVRQLLTVDQIVSRQA